MIATRLGTTRWSGLPAGGDTRGTLGPVTEPSQDHGVPGGESGFDHEQRRSGADSATAHVPFACPRCGENVTESFYGPCGACRQALTAKYAASPDVAITQASGKGASGDEPTRAQETWIDNL